MRTPALLSVTLFTLLTAGLGTGCVIHSNSHTPAALPGDVNLVWAFADGNTCASLGGNISRIDVIIPGETLQNNGSFPCQVGGIPGIQLQHFAPGTYTVTVNAVDQSGQVLRYTGTRTFTVNGNVTTNVDLIPQESPGNIDMEWFFSDGNTCSTLSSYVNSIQVVIPGQTLQNNGVFPCQVGGTQGIELQDFAPGSYTVLVTAFDRSGNAVYHGQSGFELSGNVVVQVTLRP
jgi:hypothetical protein